MEAVPPVERISNSSETSARASSSTPVLSETLISARRVDAMVGRWVAVEGRAAWRSLDAVALDLLAQRVAVQAEQLGGDRLVAAHFVQHHFDQRLFHAADDHGIDLPWLLSVKVAEVAVQSPAHAARDFV